MVLPIRKYGDPVLREKSLEVLIVDDEIRKIIQDLIQTMILGRGVGLSAPQIGVLKRILVLDAGEIRGNPRVFINPLVLEFSGQCVQEEGCLSFPGIFGEISRPSEVTVSAMNEEGVLKTFKFFGLECRAICHELDHLDGCLFIDHMSRSHRIVIHSKLKKLAKTH